MGKVPKRTLALNPALGMLLRRFVVVPSMLLVSLFCIWTAFGLIAFSLFSQSSTCIGRECGADAFYAFKPVIVLTRGLSTQQAPRRVSDAGKTAVHNNLPDGSQSSSKEMAALSYVLEKADTVAVLELAEVKSGQMQVQAEHLFDELKSLGYTRRVGNSRRRRKIQEGALERSAKTSSVGTASSRASLRNFRKAEQWKGQTEGNRSLVLTQTGSNTSRTVTEVSETKLSFKKLDKQPGFNWSVSTSVEDVEEEEKRILGAGMQRMMKNLRGYSSARSRENRSCAGRWIYSYYLPSKFNSDLTELCDSILPWYSLCEYFQNSGMGKVVTSLKAANILVPSGRWHQTNQYMLEILFHERLKQYECLTGDPSKATLFHIPYYGGIDVFRYHYANVTFQKKDELGRELVQWLENFSMWKRHGGRDHFLVLGKITWDFRRTDTDWGNTLLLFPEFQNVSKLLIEREPWQENDVGVPHPTFFHPQDDSDMDVWLSHVRSYRRDRLVSFAGMPRSTDNIRSILIDKCLRNPILCRFLECSGKVCFRPETTMHLFLRSHFCLQPVGDSATRRSVFDSLIAGCIPVLLSRDTAYVQYPWHLPRQISSYSVYVPAEDVKTSRVDVIKLLAGISKEKRQQMRKRIVDEVIPKLVYFAPNATRSARYEDAFDVSLRSLVEKSRRMHSGDL